MSQIFYDNIDLSKVAQLLNARVHNVTNAERTTLAGTLDGTHKGLFVFDTDDELAYYWNGTVFIAPAAPINGDVIFKGTVDATASLDAQVEYVAGYQYVVDTAGTLTGTGITFSPSATAEVGDLVLFTSATEAYVFQRNDAEATETVLGNVRLANQSEVNAGTDATKVVTPATLQSKLDTQQYVKNYFATVALSAGVAQTVTHNLSLVDRDNFTINVMHNNSAINVDVDSVDANSLTLYSLVSLTGVKVSVQGPSSV